MNISIIGTGQVAAVLTAKLLSAGHHVVLGSRSPTDTPHWVETLSTAVDITTIEEAAQASELIINCTPGAVSVEVLTGLDPSAMGGRVLLDVANAIVPSDGGVSLVYPNGSLGEELQKALPRVRVVKALNTMSATVMGDPAGLSGPSAVFMAGEDMAAKTTVAKILSDLGWPNASIIDLGGIAGARGPEHAFHLLGALFGALGTPRLNFAIIR